MQFLDLDKVNSLKLPWCCNHRFSNLFSEFWCSFFELCRWTWDFSLLRSPDLSILLKITRWGHCVSNPTIFWSLFSFIMNCIIARPMSLFQRSVVCEAALGPQECVCLCVFGKANLKLLLEVHYRNHWRCTDDLRSVNVET